MPVTTSAKKALRQNKKRKIRNDAHRKALKGAIKKFKKAFSPEALTFVYQKLDKAAKARVIHSNKAARLKSRLSHLIAKSKSAVS